MFSFRKLIIPSALFFIILFTFSYTIKNIYETTTRIFSFSNMPDTTDTPGEENTPADVSGMFNERGYYKSNSVSYDENEIISDFNGNLMYSIPMFKFKGPGDLSMELSLNYNGSVNHIVVAAFPSQASQQTPLPLYNISAPEWIFSLNGMGVQMLNFESNFFTHPTLSSDDVTGDGVKMLASGYNVTERLRPANNIVHDVLVIMLGDGSVVNLKRIQPSNQSCGEDGSDCYIGEYFTTAKKSYIRAKVEFIDTQGWPSYRNRRVYVMKGDGLTYIYEETKNSYYDFPLNTGNEYLKPQVLVLKSIKDRFGHILSLYYDYSIKGRPVLTRINSSGMAVNGQWSGITYFLYQPGQGGISVYNTLKGRYNIFCDNFTMDSAGHHITSVNKIVNPYNDEINITYEHYTREANNLRNDFFPNDFMNVLFVHSGLGGGLKRLKTLTNYNGGKREYTYIDNDPPSIEVDMTPANPPGYFVKSNYYYGQGRDGFFVNMLNTKTTKDQSGTSIKTESFTYSYDDLNRTDKNTEAINENDVYSTKRDIGAASSELNYNTPTSKGTIKYYKNFRLQPAPTYGINPDWDGETKLVMERYYVGDVNYPHTKVFYQFEKGDSTASGYTGSFLDTAITDTLRGQIRKNAFRYGHASSPLVNDADNPLTQQITYDPLNQKTVTDFNIYYSQIDFYWGGHYTPGGSQQMDAGMFYLINQPAQTLVYNPSGSLIHKETMSYNSATNSTAYIGQLTSQKVYDETGFTSYLETQYKYNRNDTLGLFLYLTSSNLPSNEGLLKEIIKPDGSSIKYYYRPAIISSSDPVALRRTGELYPKIMYKKVFEDRSIVTDSAYWQDTRLPVRIDAHSASGKYTSKYMIYNETGLVTKSLDNNGYVTEFEYDRLDRVTKVTLPFDYSSTELADSTTYDTTFVPVTYNVSSSHLGNKNGSTITLYETNDNDLLNQFKIDRDLSGGPDLEPGDFDINAVIRFPDDKFTGLDTVFLATVEFWPYNNYHSIDGDTSSSLYKFEVHPLKTLNATGSTWELGDGTVSFFNINAYSNLLSPSCISWPDLRYRYYAGHNTLDITTLLNMNLGNDFKGLVFNIVPRQTLGDPPPLRAKMDMTACISSIVDTWDNYFRPALHIEGIYKQVTQRNIKRFGNSTLEYLYRDDSNKVIVSQKIEGIYPNYRYKQTEYTFDGFYRVWRTKLFNSIANGNDISSSFIYYNYLDQNAKTVDANGNVTEFSYDTLGYLRQTENADNSNAYNVFGYTNSLGSYFGGSYSGFVEIRQYKDETNRDFYKYFDAVGNLLRELKYVAGDGGGNIEDDDFPFDPDTTYEGMDAPSEMIQLITDYQYDALYRLKKVKTPEGKTIEYWYDAYGRQSQRTTPDAGMTKYGYDKNGNLILSQDAKQNAVVYNLFTGRTYDGLNRLLTIGDVKPGNIVPPGGSGGSGDTALPSEFDLPSSADSLYVINAYDSLDFSSFSSLFNSNKPYDYYIKANNTKGMLCATAFRTNLADSWSFKFYRYDARGRVIRFWQKIAGMDSVKSMEYLYNGLNQAQNLSYQPGRGDWKFFRFTYDDAARLNKAGFWTFNGSPGIGSGTDTFSVPDEEAVGDGISGWNFEPYIDYRYNKNQQVDTMIINASANPLIYRHTYNNRNWLNAFFQPNSGGNDRFKYTLSYNPNGNIDIQTLTGSYSQNMGSQGGLSFRHIYDNSNRLVKSDHNPGNSDSTFDLINAYDKDGNLKKMKRFGSNNNLADNFSYEYFSGTNKLRKTSGSTDQYTYDANGNMTKDELNKNYNVLYDWRNLITDIKAVRFEDSPFGPTEVIYWTVYKYDEAGNRVRKTTYKYTGSEPDPVYEDGGDNPLWQLYSNEFYVRDVTGKEIAIYSGSSLQYWNMWGLDNVGKINSDTTRNYYLKDHLGSVRAVINSTNTVISAQDYDAWGYILQNRSYNLSAMKYDYTGKERDNETNYDYFGARYYDSRICRWGQVEPLLDKYVGVAPYCYSFDNPIVLFDPNGKDPRRDQMANVSQITNKLQEYKGQLLDVFIYKEMTGISNPRYVYSNNEGFIDLLHFFAAASVSGKLDNASPEIISEFVTGLLGHLTEESQNYWGDDSEWDPEDAWSNVQGAEFGSKLNIVQSFIITGGFIEKFESFMNEIKVIDKDDPSIARDKVKIRENQSDEKLPSRPYIYKPYFGEAVRAENN